MFACGFRMPHLFQCKTMFGGLALQNDLLFIAHAHGTPRVSAVDTESLARELTIPVKPIARGIVTCAGIAVSRTFIIHVADPVRRAIHILSPFGRPQAPIVAKSTQQIPIAPDHRGELAEPVAVAVDDQGCIYTVSAGGARVYAVQKYARSGAYLGSFRAFGVPGETFASARGICSFRDRVFVADTGNACVHVYKTNGAFLQVFSTAVIHGERSAPVAMTTDASQNLWVLERGSRQELRKFTMNGEYLKAVIGDGRIEAPTSVVVTDRGRIFILDQDGDRLRAFHEDGTQHADLMSVLEEDVFSARPKTLGPGRNYKSPRPRGTIL